MTTSVNGMFKIKELHLQGSTNGPDFRLNVENDQMNIKRGNVPLLTVSQDDASVINTATQSGLRDKINISAPVDFSQDVKCAENLKVQGTIIENEVSAELLEKMKKATTRMVTVEPRTNADLEDDVDENDTNMKYAKSANFRYNGKFYDICCQHSMMQSKVLKQNEYPRKNFEILSSKVGREINGESLNSNTTDNWCFSLSNPEAANAGYFVYNDLTHRTATARPGLYTTENVTNMATLGVVKDIENPFTGYKLRVWYSPREYNYDDSLIFVVKIDGQTEEVQYTVNSPKRFIKSIEDLLEDQPNVDTNLYRVVEGNVQTFNPGPDYFMGEPGNIADDVIGLNSNQWWNISYSLAALFNQEEQVRWYAWDNAYMLSRPGTYLEPDKNKREKFELNDYGKVSLSYGDPLSVVKKLYKPPPAPDSTAGSDDTLAFDGQFYEMSKNFSSKKDGDYGPYKFYLDSDTNGNIVTDLPTDEKNQRTIGERTIRENGSIVPNEGIDSKFGSMKIKGFQCVWQNRDNDGNWIPFDVTWTSNVNKFVSMNGYSTNKDKNTSVYNRDTDYNPIKNGLCKIFEASEYTSDGLPNDSKLLANANRVDLLLPMYTNSTASDIIDVGFKNMKDGGFASGKLIYPEPNVFSYSVNGAFQGGHLFKLQGRKSEELEIEGVDANTFLDCGKSPWKDFKTYQATRLKAELVPFNGMPQKNSVAYKDLLKARMKHFKTKHVYNLEALNKPYYYLSHKIVEVHNNMGAVEKYEIDLRIKILYSLSEVFLRNPTPKFTTDIQLVGGVVSHVNMLFSTGENSKSGLLVTDLNPLLTKSGKPKNMERIRNDIKIGQPIFNYNVNTDSLDEFSISLSYESPYKFSEMRGNQSIDTVHNRGSFELTSVHNLYVDEPNGRLYGINSGYPTGVSVWDLDHDDAEYYTNSSTKKPFFVGQFEGEWHDFICETYTKEEALELLNFDINANKADKMAELANIIQGFDDKINELTSETGTDNTTKVDQFQQRKAEYQMEYDHVSIDKERITMGVASTTFQKTYSFFDVTDIVHRPSIDSNGYVDYKFTILKKPIASIGDSELLFPSQLAHQVEFTSDKRYILTSDEMTALSYKKVGQDSRGFDYTGIIQLYSLNSTVLELKNVQSHTTSSNNKQHQGYIVNEHRGTDPNHPYEDWFFKGGYAGGLRVMSLKYKSDEMKNNLIGAVNPFHIEEVGYVTAKSHGLKDGESWDGTWSVCPYTKDLDTPGSERVVTLDTEADFLWVQYDKNTKKEKLPSKYDYKSSDGDTFRLLSLSLHENMNNLGLASVTRGNDTYSTTELVQKDSFAFNAALDMDVRFRWDNIQPQISSDVRIDYDTDNKAELSLTRPEVNTKVYVFSDYNNTRVVCGKVVQKYFSEYNTNVIFDDYNGEAAKRICPDFFIKSEMLINIPEAKAGMSGSPVFTEDGKIVGIIRDLNLQTGNVGVIASTMMVKLIEKTEKYMDVTWTQNINTSKFIGVNNENERQVNDDQSECLFFDNNEVYGFYLTNQGWDDPTMEWFIEPYSKFEKQSDKLTPIDIMGQMGKTGYFYAFDENIGTQNVKQHEIVRCHNGFLKPYKKYKIESSSGYTSTAWAVGQIVPVVEKLLVNGSMVSTQIGNVRFIKHIDNYTIQVYPALYGTLHNSNVESPDSGKNVANYVDPQEGLYFGDYKIENNQPGIDVNVFPDWCYTTFNQGMSNEYTVLDKEKFFVRSIKFNKEKRNIWIDNGLDDSTFENPYTRDINEYQFPIKLFSTKTIDSGIDGVSSSLLLPSDRLMIGISAIQTNGANFELHNPSNLADKINVDPFTFLQQEVADIRKNNDVTKFLEYFDIDIVSNIEQLNKDRFSGRKVYNQSGQVEDGEFVSTSFVLHDILFAYKVGKYPETVQEAIAWNEREWTPVNIDMIFEEFCSHIEGEEITFQVMRLDSTKKKYNVVKHVSRVLFEFNNSIKCTV
jgi:hypothetical protein